MPVEQRKWFEKPVQEYLPLSVRTLRQWISQTKIIFKDNKNRKTDHRKITEYFNTDKTYSKQLIPETNSNDIRREPNSKIQNNTENRKRRLKNKEKTQELQTVLNYTNKNIHEKHPNNNGKIIMSTNTDINGNNDHNSGCEYRDEEVNSKLNKIEKVAKRTDIIEMVQTMKYKKDNKNNI